MTLKDKTIGVMYLDSKIVKGVFSFEDAQVLEAMASHISIAIESNKIARLEIERAQAIKDLEITGSVQRLLIPTEDVFETKDYKIRSYFQSADQSGGDWIWYEPLQDGSVICLIGDVTGHGPGPAMMTSAIAGAFRTLRGLFPDEKLKDHIPDIMRAFQECIKNIGGGEYWMSMSVVLFDKNHKSFKQWSAGAPPTFVYKKQGDHRFIKSPSSPLGNENFQIDKFRKIDVESGDIIFIFTDGVYELHKSEQDYMTLGKFQKKLSNFDQGLSSDAFQNSILDLIRTYSSDQQADDITFMILEVV